MGRKTKTSGAITTKQLEAQLQPDNLLLSPEAGNRVVSQNSYSIVPSATGQRWESKKFRIGLEGSYECVRYIYTDIINKMSLVRDR